MRGLSRSEIRKDLQEIEHFDKSDCESVSSAASDDVLPSSYPVKPRAHARVLKEHRVSRVLKNEVDNADTLESALEFMRVVEAARPEIFEAEREREDLEIRFEVHCNVPIGCLLTQHRHSGKCASLKKDPFKRRRRFMRITSVRCNCHAATVPASSSYVATTIPSCVT